MISISLKKFKSFLTMSPADRKQIIDRVFNLEAVNIAFEKIKKDGRDISAAINSDNSTLFQLGQTFQRATNELTALQEKFKNEVNKTEIEENNKKIQEITDNVTKLTTAYQEYSTAQQELTTKINDIKKRQYENNFNIKTIDEKLQLFSQAKCPTCGVSFVSESYTELKQKLADLKNAKNAITAELNNELNEVNTQYSNVNSYLTKINNTIYQYKSEISTLANKNKMLEEQFKSSAEFSSIQNIVNSTAEQMDAIKQQLSDNSLKLKDLQNLALVYSIDGVKQKVIINYLPILNDEIEHNLQLLNFPYQLDIDSKFEPHLKELGVELSPETLSDGEEARVDLVILCSLFKPLKRRFPTINILSIDEVISSLDSESSGLVLEFLKEYAKENNLSCFIVSHTDLFLDNFDKIIEVNKDGFSKINVFIPNV
jgi:DNA repair exonuclease SbcCD ATPase subunit